MRNDNTSTRSNASSFSSCQIFPLHGAHSNIFIEPCLSLDEAIKELSFFAEPDEIAADFERAIAALNNKSARSSMSDKERKNTVFGLKQYSEALAAILFYHNQRQKDAN